MKSLFLSGFALLSFFVQAQTSLVLKNQKPSELDLATYTQIAVGDIVGPTGSKTEQSLDLTDALTAALFNSKTVEVLDRNTLDNILSNQKYRDLQVIDESTTQLLNKKLTNALLITGRIQSRPLEQKLLYNDQSIVINGCNRTYFYEVKGEVAIQLKVLDVKTGRMLFSDAVLKNIKRQTKETCEVPAKLDLNEISRIAIRDLAEEISKLLIPYELSTTLVFSEPGLLKSPFKKISEAAAYLKNGSADEGLAILKDYTKNSDIKDKHKDDAWYNYGLGLLYAGKYEEAKTALQQSSALDAAHGVQVAALIKLMEDQKVATAKLEAQTLARQKKNAATETGATQPAGKTATSAKTKKS